MIKKNTLISVIFVLLISLKASAVENVYIVYKIDSKIITNIDIKNESKYLLALNQQLKSINVDQLLNLSKQSIIKETIKKKEVLKYFKLEQKELFLDSFIENFYIRLNLKSLVELENYLDEFNLTILDLKKKFEIEHYWNKIIFEKYNKKININEENIRKRIKEKKMIKDKKIYSLSEIIFEKEQNITLEEKMEKISESIKEIGFKNTANLYSVSDSAKFGGDIGWVEEDNLSEKIASILKVIELGNHSEAMEIGANFLIINIDNIKFEKKEINEEEEFIKIYNYEKNRKLDQFSKIYFDKIKINTKIDEL